MIIGITGGVGCGKSTVLNLLMNEYGFTVIDADKVAHMLMLPGNESYKKIVEYFGSNILLPDGTINRKELGEIVFNDKNRLKVLNGFVHEDVKNEIKRMIADEKENCKDVKIAIEAALLIEAGFVDICEKVWYIYTSEEIRINRLIETRGYSKEKAKSIISNQLSENEFRKHSDEVIDNSGLEEDTHKQIKELFNKMQ